MSEIGKLVENEGKEERKDSEEIPVWADSLTKAFDSLREKVDALWNKGGDEEPARVGMDKSEGAEELDEYLEDHRIEDRDEAKADAEGDESATDMGSEPDPDKELENGVIRENTEGQERADLRGHRADESEEKRERDEKRGGERALGEKIEKERLERKDSSRADSVHAENKLLRDRLDRLEKDHAAKFRRLTEELSYEDKTAIADARSNAEGIYAAVGLRVSEPLHGEKPTAYRKRLVQGLKKFSKQFKDTEIAGLSGSVFDKIEETVYADALSASRTSAVTGPGVLRPHTFMRGPLQFTEYHGDPDAWMAPFKGVGAKVNIIKAEGAR